MQGIVLHLQVLGWRNVGACAPCNSRMPQVAPASTATGPWLARAAEPHATKTYTRGPQSHTPHGRRIKMTSTVFVLVLLLSFSDPWFTSCLVSLVHLLKSMTNGHQTNMSSRLYLNTVSYVLCSYNTFPTSSSWHEKSPCHFGNHKPSLSLHLAVTSIGQRLFSVQYMILFLFEYGNIYRYIFSASHY